MASVELLVGEGIKKITPYVPGKPIEELEKEYKIKGAVKMASNENPLGPSPKALEAIKNCLNSIHRYPDAASLRLKERLAQKLGVHPECILPANGSNEILELTIKTFLRPGCEVIIPEPTFTLYEKFTLATDGVPIRVPLKNCGIDVRAIRERITSKTTIIFLNNPNNPTGTIVKRREFEELLKNIPSHTIIVLDEAYGEFVEDPDFPQGKNYLQGPPWVITLRTFSKVYGLAGLRIGYGLAAQSITQYLNKVRQPFNVNSLAQTAALAALDDDEHFEKTIRVVCEGRKFLCEQLDQLGISYIPSQSNFIMIHLGKNCSRLYEAMLRMGVIVRPLNSFGFPDDIRVSIGTPQENERFIETLKKGLKNNT